MRDNFIKLDADGVAFLPETLNSSWYAGLKDNIKDHLLIYDGTRELIYPRSVIQSAITLELIAKKYMLDTLYDTMNFDYNPIWNVDGTETLEFERHNTGTVGNAGTTGETVSRSVDIDETHTGTTADAHTGTTTTADTGTDTTAHTGTETTVEDYSDSVTHGGTVTTNHTGTDTTAHTGTVGVTDDTTDTATTSKTAYNDATFINAEKVVDVIDKDTTTTYNETTQETRNLSDAEIINTNDETEKDVTDTKTLATQDQRTLNTQEQTTHADTVTTTNNLTDTHDEDHSETRSGTESNTRTDNLTETYEETKTRSGNIGVTSTQSLIQQEREVARFSFLEVVCKTITDAVCMGVYDCE